MHVKQSRAAKVASALAAPIAIIAASAMIWQASYAAFSSQTRNSGNDWSTGTVVLSDDDSGAARFQVANLLPEQTDTKCIEVTAHASVPGVVKGYALNPVTSPQRLEDHILVTVEDGTGGSFASCSGFVASSTLIPGVPLATLFGYDSYANAVGGWPVTGGVPGGETRTYRVTWHFATTGLTQAQLDQLQGAHTGLDFQWELQSS